MNYDNIDSIILGTGQFFGVNHLSLEKGRNKDMYFGDIQNAIKIIRYVVQEEKIKGIMLSTHPRSIMIIETIKKDPFLKENLNFYLNIPYMQKFISQSNEIGIVNTLTESIKRAKSFKKIKMVFEGGTGYVRKDLFKLLKTIIDIEMLPFKDLNVKAFFLHNVIADLILAFRSEVMIDFYVNYIKEEYDIIPAFTTQNLPKMVSFLEQSGIKNPLILTPFNKIGFSMNPSLKECEECLEKTNIKVAAHSTLASGYLKPYDAYEYIFALSNRPSVVVGVSTKEHARETFQMIKSFL